MELPPPPKKKKVELLREEQPRSEAGGFCSWNGSSRQACSTNEEVKASHATRASEGIYSVLFRKLHEDSTRGVVDRNRWSFYMRYGLRNVCR